MSSHMWVTTARLNRQSQIANFQCGRESVDDWLRTKALTAHPHVKTTLFLDSTDSVIAFAATTMMIVDITEASSALRSGSRDGDAVGFLLAQMGVRSDLAGQGIGKAVVRHVFEVAADSYENAPFPLFVVDAADESLVTYYRALGLRPLAGQLRLATPMRQVLRSLRRANLEDPR